MKSLPFLFLHFACLLVFWCGVSWAALAVCALLYALRVGSISAGFHRYFSHRTYKTTRAFQFLLAWIATSATQKGPLWWAANHRHHHAHSDTPRPTRTRPATASGGRTSAGSSVAATAPPISA